MKKLLLLSGNSSIGPDIIKKFLSSKYSIVSTYNKKKLIFKNKGLRQIKLNVQNDHEIKLFLQNIKNQKFDSVIFCTGFIYGKKFSDYTLNEAKNIFDINFFSILNLFSLLKKNFKKDACIIFISSISSEQGSYDSFYAASKAALNMMIKNIAKELAKKLRIIAVSPSLIKNTKMYFDMTKENRLRHIQKNPQKSLILKEDLAKILFHICQKEWKKLNGVNLNINGGI